MLYFRVIRAHSIL